ncbi:TPA: hypothetical protein PFE33_003379 [Kluyvera ascorbata]|nr:hypothetical protein [Kluyvera ascorbata]HED1310872.1 hypothetical protein [Kluyvera ascorbata]
MKNRHDYPREKQNNGVERCGADGESDRQIPEYRAVDKGMRVSVIQINIVTFENYWHILVVK